MLFCSETEFIDRLVSTGSESTPSLSHVMIGAGLPLKVQVNITGLCSMTTRVIGLSITVGSTKEKTKIMFVIYN